MKRIVVPGYVAGMFLASHDRICQQPSVSMRSLDTSSFNGAAVSQPRKPKSIPQSDSGFLDRFNGAAVSLSLAVHIVLARFDDHLSYDIPRRHMVQWVEHIATWLQPIAERMWQALRTGGYLQVDETPVKVLDPEVRGKAARGYLWFYAVPGGCHAGF